MASETTNFAHLRIPLEDVLKATNNFHKDNIIGHGGFGTAYKGLLLRSGKSMKIALRRLDRKHGEGDIEFWTEISVLSDLNHSNIVSIIGFCDEKKEKIIITTYQAKGSLKEYLNDPTLTWTQRLRISVGVARALSYLRYEEGRGFGVILRNINNSSILLDKNWEPKLSGFEFSIKQSVYQMDQVLLSEPIHAKGYTDPAILKTDVVTYKSDIYSFGVVLFEMLCGREAYIKNDANRFLSRLAKYHHEKETLDSIVHPDLWNHMSIDSFLVYSKVAYSCLKEEPSQRPGTDYIVDELQYALELQLRRDNLEKKLEHLKIRLSDIALATENFSKKYMLAILDKCALYGGELDHFDTENLSSVEVKNNGEHPKKRSTVVIKRYPCRHDGYGEKQFVTEIEMLTTVKHPNIVTLLGFCFERSEMILVTEFYSNGYLGFYLSNINNRRHILTWEKRLKICIDVAHALNYLHSEVEDQKTIIHRVIQCYNITLDENFGAKIVDFRYSVSFLPQDSVDGTLQLNIVAGTNFSTDPEYEMTGKLKRESDVYSFGVVLLESLCGRIADDPIYLEESEKGLVHVVRRCFNNGTLEDMIDPIIKEPYGGSNFLVNRGPNKDSLDTFIKIAYKCVAETQDQRPTMKVVIKELEKSLNFQENNKDNLRISLEDVKLATQNFHDDSCIGGSVGKVYKGKIPQGDAFITIVAKRLDTRFGPGENHFLNEIQILSECKHDNIISLVGYCNEKDEKVIIYEYASRGSLDKYLNDASLTWIKRLNICIDIASALDFLHGGVGREPNVIMHRDITTNNILLTDNWKAKITGFGLSSISPQNQETNNVIDHVCGTPENSDPLYIKSGFFTKESDIYSFGMVLFEILCGRSTHAIHKHEGHYLPDFIRNKFEEGKHDEVVFEQIKEQIVPKSLTMFQTIAYQCLHHPLETRPTAKEVLVKLKKTLEFQEEIQHPNMDQKMNQVVDRPQNTLENQGDNLEHLKIHLTDIKLATNNFSKTCQIATTVPYILYRAELDHYDKENPLSLKGKNKREDPKGHNTVLIKRYRSRHVEKELFKEIEMLVGIKHPNILDLLGFCVEGSEMIIITRNISNGLLDSYLGDVNPMRHILTWEKRLKICIDVALALNYLHCEMENQKIIIKRNIRSRTIGLDENWRAKIYDFGLSVYLPPNQDGKGREPIRVGNTFYEDPEFKMTHKLKKESDVYSFGVVLFEILCGRKAFDQIYVKESDKGLAHVARRSFSTGMLEDIIDPILKEETREYNFLLNRGPNKDSLHTFIEIAHQCVAETQDKRPTMEVVIKELKKALFFQKNNKDNPRISLEDINHATRYFNKENNIGRGGFGSVFRGNLQDGDGFKTIVAKRLDKKSNQGEKEFLTELQILLEYKHENIIGLVGYCDENDEKIIVYEYASRGDLQGYLDSASLSWIERLNICIDVASALYFLHGGVGKQAKVIHRDIKTANILLNDDQKAMLADFGLSLISPLIQQTDYIVDHACGTPGYLDPLYHKSGFLTIESDIYSFGVVLFEILCGRSTFAIKKHEGHYLPDFIKKKIEQGKTDEVVFKQIRDKMVPKSLTTFQKIAYQCLHHEREKRPTTKEVLIQLKKALEFQNMASTMDEFARLKISLQDVVKATNNFHDDNMIIRHDRFGTLYKGQLLRSERSMKIAARRFNCKHGEGDLEFLAEMSALFYLKHTNLVSIIGFCDEKEEKIIITKYEANESLGQYLTSPNLTWTQRLRICVGLARALSYLHYDKGRDYGIIHCNISSDSILLDENMETKLSGFEISVRQSIYYKDRGCPCEHIGTMGCIDPAIEKTGGVTHKSDIYSFGVVLFEILCGRKAFIENEDERFLAPLAKYHYENKTLHEIIHPDLYLNQMSPQSLLKYSNIAYSCLNEDQALRPNMDYIIDELEKALELQLRVENIGEDLKHLQIHLSDIKLATNNFSEACTIASWDLSTWYRAKLDHFDKASGKIKGDRPEGHITIVMKRYPFGDDGYGEDEFFTEIEMLTSVKHPNIVTLLGYCIEGSEMILVIEDVSNGYLGHDYLGNVDRMRILTWERRLKICIDVALALNYLHSKMEDQKIIINRDINSRNIALDESFGAKIVDFWFSIFLPPDQEDEALYVKNYLGRWSYVDPEYKETGKLTRKSDVYSFGVVLFEILCDKGLSTVIKQKFCKETVEGMIDPILMEETGENNFVLNRGPNKDSLHTFIDIAQQCVVETQDPRPTMEVVIKELKKALFFQENNKDNPSRIPLEDIKLATQNFNDDNCIGKERFWKVYKGNLQDGDGVNAIVSKRLDTGLNQREKQFMSELQILWEYKHENVIGLVGYCDEHDEKIIVYEHASRGSLDKYLNDASITWMKRLNICIDVASALDFIHGGVRKQASVIHRNIKTANIVLDHDWKAKLFDFGFSLISPVTQETDNANDHVCSTIEYLDPLCKKSGIMSIESDIYSFGVVLFEILCGRSAFAIHEHEGHYLPDFIKSRFEGKLDEVVFEQIREQIVPESLIAFQEIAYQCLHHEKERRPVAQEVLMQLQLALGLQISKGE